MSRLDKVYLGLTYEEVRSILEHYDGIDGSPDSMSEAEHNAIRKMSVAVMPDERLPEGITTETMINTPYIMEDVLSFLDDHPKPVRKAVLDAFDDYDCSDYISTGGSEGFYEYMYTLTEETETHLANSNIEGGGYG